MPQRVFHFFFVEFTILVEWFTGASNVAAPDFRFYINKLCELVEIAAENIVPLILMNVLSRSCVRMIEKSLLPLLIIL